MSIPVQILLTLSLVGCGAVVRLSLLPFGKMADWLSNVISVCIAIIGICGVLLISLCVAGEVRLMYAMFSILGYAIVSVSLGKW